MLHRHNQYCSASLYCLCHNLGEALVRTSIFANNSILVGWLQFGFTVFVYLFFSPFFSFLHYRFLGIASLIVLIAWFNPAIPYFAGNCPVSRRFNSRADIMFLFRSNISVELQIWDCSPSITTKANAIDISAWEKLNQFLQLLWQSVSSVGNHLFIGILPASLFQLPFILHSQF